MQLKSLRVLHLRKNKLKDSAASTALAHVGPVQGSFFLDSCQRYVWVCSDDLFSQSVALAQVSAFSECEVLKGQDAYLFLLRVACGLESEIQGETDIFGQLKTAWKANERNAEPGLGSWMQRVFEDTKEIRSRYLQNLGGASYGTLVRKILKDTLVEGPILIAGAGQIARSVAPFLLEQEIWITNRSAENLEEFARELESQGGRVRRITPAEEAEAWTRAAHVVVCVPRDASRVATESVRGAVVHLGASRSELGAWTHLPRLFALDDLFRIQKSLGEVRSTHIAQAARACEERVKLRDLGASITIAHGWEDLAIFA